MERKYSILVPCGRCLLGLLILGVAEGTGLELSVPGHAQGGSFCFYLTARVQAFVGQWQRWLSPQAPGGLYDVLKVPSFPEKLLQFSLKVGDVDPAPSLDFPEPPTDTAEFFVQI